MHNKTRYEWRPTEENRIEFSVVREKNQRKTNIYGSLKSRTGQFSPLRYLFLYSFVAQTKQS